MSRAAVNYAIENDGGMLGLGLEPGATFAANAVDTPMQRPFVVMRWEEKTPAFGDKGVTSLTVWVHDKLGDYARIDAMIERIKLLLTTMTHVAGSDGFTITQIDWTGDSQDLYDDGFSTISRNAGFRVVSRPT